MRRQLMGRSMRLKMLSMGMLTALMAGPVLGEGRLLTPSTPAQRVAVAAGAKTSMLTQLPASELLALSAAALSQTSSYQFSGPASVATMSARAKARASSPLDLSGAYQKPAQNYSKVVAKTKSGAKSAVAETYSDGTAVYVRASAGKKTGSWTKTSQQAALQGNPFAVLQLASKTVSTVTAGADATVNGKQYITLIAVLNEAAAQELLSSLLSASGYSPSGSTAVSGKAEATMTYFVDPKTYLAEVSRFAGSQTITQSGGTSLKVSVSGELALKGINAPVTMPDVSSATTPANSAPAGSQRQN